MKNLRFLVAAIVVLLLLAACGPPREGAAVPTPAPAPPAAGADDGADVVGEVGEREWMELSVMMWDAAHSFSDTIHCEIYEYIQNRFQITFRYYNVTHDNVAEMTTLWAVAGTLPEIIGAQRLVGRGLMKFEWIDAGIIRPLPQDTYRFPYVQKWLDMPGMVDYQVNGYNWFAPRGTQLDTGWMIMGRNIINRRDWRESLGIPVPETTEDFLNMWRAFVENDMHGDGRRVHGMLPLQPWSFPSQTFFTFGDTRVAWVMLDDGSMVIPALERSALPLMSFLRDAYRDGLIDPDFVTNHMGQANIDFAAGRVGTILSNGSPSALHGLMHEFAALSPDVDFFEAVELLHPPVVPGVQPRYGMADMFWSETFFNSSVCDVRMERILEYFNWGYSTEAINMMLYGFEGRDFVIEDGEIVQLTAPHPETGFPMMAADLYPFANGGMSNLVNWNADLVEFYTPAIPLPIRQMATEFRDAVRDNPASAPVQFNNRIRTFWIEEMMMMFVDANNEWVLFITDTRDISNEDLWEQLAADWANNGYEMVKEAMTAAIREAGITP